AAPRTTSAPTRLRARRRRPAARSTGSQPLAPVGASASAPAAATRSAPRVQAPAAAAAATAPVGQAPVTSPARVAPTAATVRIAPPVYSLWTRLREWLVREREPVVRRQHD